MAERRRFRRIPVFLKIKKTDQSPLDVSNLLDVSAFGAKIETTTKYKSGDLIKFSYAPPGPSARDSEINRRGDAIWGIPEGMFREKLICGKVVWVLPHPNKTKHFLVGLDLSTKRHEHLKNFLLIILMALVGIGIVIAIERRDVLYGHMLGIVEGFLLPLKEAIQAFLYKWFPF